jgi:hypothetical protein
MHVKSSPNTFDHSRPLDVHRWSDHPEADRFVDEVYGKHFESKQSRVERKHLKVILLDLYVAWLEHPDLKIAVPMRPAAYRAKTNRYNKLHISSKTIGVVKTLTEVGLIEMKIGFYDRTANKGKLTRIWPTRRLIEGFQKAGLSVYMVGVSEEQEVILLKDDERNQLAYRDTPATKRMRDVVRAYNGLLARSFIDIRRLDDPWIEGKDGSKLIISPNRQKVYRVFNRGDFGKGGRFFGPWWQGCPKMWRKEIFINDAPTAEQDYSSIHIALLYAKNGIDYYASSGGDAYLVDVPDFLQTPEQTRAYAKLLFLMAINAKTDKKAFAAFRENRKDKGDVEGSRLKDVQLQAILNSLRAKHPQIADGLGSDAGIELMNQDAQITEHVIERFTEKDIPVLTLHDSYIVAYGDTPMLDGVLTEAYEKLTGYTTIKSETVGVVLGDETSWRTDRLPVEAMTITNGYKRRLIDWLCYKNEIENAGSLSVDGS